MQKLSDNYTLEKDDRQMEVYVFLNGDQCIPRNTKNDFSTWRLLEAEARLFTLKLKLRTR